MKLTCPGCGEPFQLQGFATDACERCQHCFMCCACPDDRTPEDVARCERARRRALAAIATSLGIPADPEAGT